MPANANRNRNYNLEVSRHMTTNKMLNAQSRMLPSIIFSTLYGTDLTFHIICTILSQFEKCGAIINSVNNLRIISHLHYKVKFRTIGVGNNTKPTLYKFYSHL